MKALQTISDTLNLPTVPLPRKRILVVARDEGIRQEVARSLEIEGHTVHRAQDESAAEKFVEFIQPDLIILDLGVISESGFNLYHHFQEIASLSAIPFIFLIDQENPELLHQNPELTVEAYLTKPLQSEIIARVVNTRLLHAADLQVSLIDQAYLETVDVLANSIEGRDPYTHGHVERVATYAGWLGTSLGWSAENMRMLAFGSRLHDIGKIIVPDQVLKKNEGLTMDEWALMHQHPEAGARIIRNIRHLQPAEPYVLYHHERWDGSGYPYGLGGREIPIEGRLLAIADVYDALTTTRPYHPAKSQVEVVGYLTRRAGTHFDPDLVPVFISAIREQEKG